ncbi:hypothetical protein CFP66_28105 [Pseudonocardia sp. MH-G8]|nr:hypothetical protein CFP66_28105 [Pseudonocardia sp. MH-G8]
MSSVVWDQSFTSSWFFPRPSLRMSTIFSAFSPSAFSKSLPTRTRSDPNWSSVMFSRFPCCTTALRRSSTNTSSHSAVENLPAFGQFLSSSANAAMWPFIRLCSSAPMVLMPAASNSVLPATGASLTSHAAMAGNET